MERLEFKYLVPIENMDKLRNALMPFLERDAHTQSQRDDYTVHSIYFDTLTLDYYYEKESGIQHRRKIRVRGYDTGSDTAPIFLEIKRKNNMSISKNRAPAEFRNLRQLFATGNIEQYVPNSGTAKEDANRFFYHVFRHSLRPTVLVNYDREAFFQKFDDSVRITFDKNLRSIAYPKLEDLYKEENVKYSMPGFFVLEVKFFKGIPSWCKRILEEFQLERTAVSKYTISLDTHNIPETHTQRSVFAITDACCPNSGQRRKATHRFPAHHPQPFKVAAYGS